MGFDFSDVTDVAKDIGNVVFPVQKFASFDLPKLGLDLSKGSLLDSLNPTETTQTQEALQTPEQKAAKEELLQFALRLQKEGGFDPGTFEGIFEPSSREQEIINRRFADLDRDLPAELDFATSALENLLSATEADIGEQFDPFKTRVQREIEERQTALKRQSAFTGDLFGTKTIEELGDVESRGTEVLTSELARLTDVERDRTLRRLQTIIPGAINTAQAREGIRQGRLGAASDVAGLSRVLSQQGATQKREEELLPLKILQSISGQNVPFGVPEIKTFQPSPTQQLLKSAASIAPFLLI